MKLLYWNEVGRIGCLQPGHMPCLRSELFNLEGWCPLSAEETKHFEEEVGEAPVCDVCSEEALQRSRVATTRRNWWPIQRPILSF